jgi:hypothetical protein
MSFLLNKNKDENKIITLSTCWYILKSKFNVKTYLSWITNLLSIVGNFNLVIYTDVSSLKHFVHLIDFSNKKIKIIITPIEEFYTYKYKDSWIKNHEKSNLKLHSHVDWRLNMLWNEKIFFVNETIKKKYFNTLYYGWCDIGYFRNRPNDLHCDYLKNWPNNQKLLDGFFNEKIHYACVQNDKSIYLNLQNDIITHYSNKLESHSPIQPTTQIEEICFAGGFFGFGNRGRFGFPVAIASRNRFTINRDKLANLTGDELLRLNQSGFLAAAFLVIASLGNMQKLIDIKNSKN